MFYLKILSKRILTVYKSNQATGKFNKNETKGFFAKKQRGYNKMRQLNTI